VLLQDPDDLLFRKTIALHALVLVLGQSELQTGLSPRGKVTDDRHWLPARSGTVHGGGTMMFRPTGTITVE
jgi:hypothetical protein